MGHAPTALPPPEETTDTEWELAAQWAAAWRVIKWAITAIIVIACLVVIGQGFLFYDVFARVHPWLGYGFVGVLATLLFVLVGRPMLAYIRTPVMATPPTADIDPSAPDPSAMAERVSYDLKYLKALKKNPALKAERSAIDEDIAYGRALLGRARSARGDRASAVLLEIQTFETDRIEQRLAAIDAEVDRLIHAEAVAVGVATALSMNGTVDAFVVLWRNANLVSKIARLYFGRPNLRGSLLILRDVAAIVVMARALEDITNMTGELIGGLLGRMGGLVAGPVMDGAINAMMTLKLGYLAKGRCRSFEAWTPKRAPFISAQALERVKQESTAVITDLLRKCGGMTASAARTAEKAMAGSKNAWETIMTWFGQGPTKI